MFQVGYLQILYRYARSTEHKIFRGIFVHFMPFFEIQRAIVCNNFAKHHLVLNLSQHLNLSRQWRFKGWSHSESNTILCPLVTRSGNFSVSLSFSFYKNVWSRPSLLSVTRPLVSWQDVINFMAYLSRITSLKIPPSNEACIGLVEHISVVGIIVFLCRVG